VVAVDSPDNLTSRLRGSETMFLQVDAGGADATDVLKRVPGITDVRVAEMRGAVTALEVQSETGRDVRRELASAVVNRGWGLLELRPMRMSLEEIFLHLTTEDTAATEPAGGGAR
jgi:ABC-2 type transport system ATP-binding protein